MRRGDRSDSRPSRGAGFRTGFRLPIDGLRSLLLTFCCGQRPLRVDPLGWCNALQSRHGVSRIVKETCHHSCGCKASMLKHSIYVVKNPVLFSPGDGGRISSIGYAIERDQDFAARIQKLILIPSINSCHHHLDIPSITILKYPRWPPIHLRR